MNTHQKRVVITGMGVISPVGLDVDMWHNLICGVSGIGPLTAFDATDYDARIAGEARSFDPQNYMSIKEARRMDRFAQFAVAALGQAMEQSKLEINEHNAAISKQLKANSQSVLLTGFNRRFAPLTQQLKASLSPHHEPKHIYYRVNAGPIPLNHWTQDPEVGGGRIIGEACHFIDFITFLVGEDPISVNAIALPDSGKYREDNVSMTFTFPDGSIGIVDYLANGDKSFPKERVEVFCGGQVSVLDDFVALQTVRDGRKNEAKGAQDKGWVNEWKVLIRSIREGGEPPIPYEQLIGVAKSTFAVVESLRMHESKSI